VQRVGRAGQDDWLIDRTGWRSGDSYGIASEAKLRCQASAGLLKALAA
jgi:hypothetical protein